MAKDCCTLQVASVSFGVGSLVWVEDPDVAWIDGEVTAVKGDDITIQCTSGKTVSVNDKTLEYLYLKLLQVVSYLFPSS